MSGTVSLSYRFNFPKLKFTRNFPLYNSLQSKSNSKKMRKNSSSFCSFYCRYFILTMQKYNFSANRANILTFFFKNK